MEQELIEKKPILIEMNK